MSINKSIQKGFTLIELMIVIAISALLLAIALPACQDYSIRAKVAEGLSVAASAKVALAETCQSDSGLILLDDSDAGYAFSASTYVANVAIAVDCSSGTMVIGIRTQNTGADNDPIIYLSTNGLFFIPVQFLFGETSATWICVGLAESQAHLPAGCRIAEPDFFEGGIGGLGGESKET